VANNKTSDLPLTRSEAYAHMERVLRGELSPDEIRHLLIAYNDRAATSDELAGFLQAVREAATPIDLAAEVAGRTVDIVGTGGDQSGSVNVSTMAALVVAGAGVPVCKHGNRSASSQCGSADVLEVLGVNIQASPNVAVTCLAEVGIAFFFAPTFHPAMKHAAQARKDLGIRTAFNLLGPLTNPARPSRQIVGVPRPDLTELMARALALLGSERAWVVHGADGLDELSTTGYTKVSECRNNTVQTFYVHPADFGLAKATSESLKGGDAQTNAAIVSSVLSGTKGAPRDVVLMNSGAALFIAGQAVTVRAGVAQAEAAIDSGAASAMLETLVRVSNGGSK